MPSHLQRMQLKGKSCVSTLASCDEHEGLRVRIRKADLTDPGNGGMREVDIYARCAPSESLQVRLGSTLTIALKDGRELDFRVVAIRVLSSCGAKVRRLRTCILSGYLSR
jgi:hypothetical protein